MQFSKHITTTFPHLKDKKLLIAISGGLDSVVLTELLHQLDYSISLAHCNFQLRDTDSNQDEIFVNAMANRLQRTIYTTHFDTKSIAKKEKLSIQMAARKLRYDWFNTLLSEHNFDFLLTAHHADDNLETFLINLTRGTGLDGLIGIPEKNNHTLRPLLPFCRNQIEHYAVEHNLTWREDSSNNHTKYLRNKLRHDVIPALKEANPKVLDAFSTTIQHLKQTQQIVLEAVEEKKKNIIISSTDGTLKLDIKALQKLKYIKAYLYNFLKEYNFTAWNDINSLLEARTGKVIYSNTHRIIKNRDSILITPLPHEENNIYRINEIGEHHFPQFSLNIRKFHENFKVSSPFEKTLKATSGVFCDADKLKFPLTLRKYQKGDYFQPFGMQGKKKLSKYLKDEKVSLPEKENVWVLISDQTIVWVINYRLDDKFKISDRTKTVVKLDYKSN